jgi:hypothetical protein
MPRTGGGGRLKVRGLRETVRAFNNIQEDLSDELRAGLKHAAEPVRVAAEQKAVNRIENMPYSPAWAEQKTVVSKRTALVYMGPKKRQSRNTARRRKNLADLLMERAMEPALEENEEKTKKAVELVLDQLGRKNGF